MLSNLKESGLPRKVGILLVGGLIIVSWWLGWFYVVFYVLGLYAAVYVISYLFKTTVVAGFLMMVGGFILYVASGVIGLYWLYLILNIMFTGSFFYGLLLLVLLGTFGQLLYFIPMAIGLALGFPLIFISNDIEERFSRGNQKIRDAEHE